MMGFTEVFFFVAIGSTLVQLGRLIAALEWKDKIRTKQPIIIRGDVYFGKKAEVVHQEEEK